MLNRIFIKIERIIEIMDRERRRWVGEEVLENIENRMGLEKSERYLHQEH